MPSETQSNNVQILKFVEIQSELINMPIFQNPLGSFFKENKKYRLLEDFISSNLQKEIQLEEYSNWYQRETEPARLYINVTGKTRFQAKTSYPFTRSGLAIKAG